MPKKVGPRAKNGNVAPRAIKKHRQGMGGSGKVSQRHLFFVQPKHISENLECMSVTDKRWRHKSILTTITPSKN